MTLDERKRRILKAVIDDYIDTAEPIGSRTIARKHELGLSSATIRNEMSDLEEMGFLVQPHTSAGRVPSDRGYRLYVDELMNIRILTPEEIKSVSDVMEVRINEIGQLIRKASLLMSKLTRYTAMAVTPKLKEMRIKAVQIVPIDAAKVLVIVVANGGIVRNSMVQLPRTVEPDLLIKMSGLINERLCGLSIQQAEKTREEAAAIMGRDADLVPAVYKGIEQCFTLLQEDEVHIDGTTNIFDLPEFKDVFKAREFLSILDEKETLYWLMSPENNKGIRIKIGAENEFDEIKDYSLVKATYSYNDSVIGAIGIIGPTRMEYPKVISSLDLIRNFINEDLKKLFGEGLNDD